MGSESGTYEYTPLPTATSIRLLEILGEDEDGLLQCNLEIVDLIDLPIYNCLSYTWGNPYPEGVYSGTEGPDYGESNTWPISCGGDLHLVSQNLYDALQMLRQNRVTIAEQPDSRQRTRLHLAAESGDLDIVSHLLHNGADSASQDIDEQTPMDRAIENDHHHAVRMMIQSECDKANVDTSNGVPKTSKEIRHDRLLKSTNRYVQSLQVHGEPAKSSGRPGIERSFIWIDALCIDQNNNEERGAQVKLMEKIYGSAETVIMWLGPHAGSTRTAVELISELANDRLDEKWDFFYGGDVRSMTLDKQAALNILRISSISDSRWDALIQLFQMSYFKRAWVNQEIALARNVLVFCGSFQIPWVELYRASTFLTLSEWSLVLMERGHATERFGSEPFSWMTVNQGIQHGKVALGINLILVRGRPTHATDPRDKIYSALGFSSSESTASVVVDYSKSVKEVYTEAARAILLHSDNLHDLHYIEGGSFRKTPGLPSWVPDFDVLGGRPTPFISLGGRNKNHFHAAGSITRQLRFPASDLSKLHIFSHEFDTIDRTGSSNDERNRQFEDWLDLILSLPATYPTGQDRTEVFWRTLIADTANDISPAPPQTKNAFKPFLFIQLGTYFGLDGPTSRSKQAVWVSHAKKMDQLGLWPSQEEQIWIKQTMKNLAPGEQLPDQAFAYNFGLVYSWRRLFRTRRGYLGIGSQEVRPGDEVWVVPGGKTPFVLRKLENGNHVLVGDAYVHGITRGELVGTEGWKLEEVVLE